MYILREDAIWRQLGFFAPAIIRPYGWPKQFRLRGTEAEIFRRGDEIVLRERGKGLERAFEILANLAADIFPEGAVMAPHRGGMDSTNDLWIASHAQAAGLILVTNNEQEFRPCSRSQAANLGDITKLV